MKTRLLRLLAALPWAFASPGRAYTGPPAASPPAEVVLGDFTGATFANPMATGVFSMALDAASGKLFVSSGNQILRFSSQAQLTNGGLPQATFPAQNVSGLAMDGAGHLWAASNNRVLRFDNAALRADAPVPDGVLGQPDFTGNTAAAGPGGMNGPKSLALDPTGCLWVADTGNHRVIGFLNAASKGNGDPADLLLGQPNWTNTGTGVAPTRMTQPKGLAVDGTGTLWVVDHETRALRFDNPSGKPNGAAPDGKFVPAPPFTQLSFTMGGNGLSRGPAGSLWMAALRGPAVLFRFDTPATATGMVTPDGILGSGNVSSSPSAGTLLQPEDVVEDAATGKVFVVDKGNHRVLRYPSVKLLNSGAPADAVFGQPDFSTTTSGTGPAKLFAPLNCALDPSGNLWVSDAGNHRVLRYANAVSSVTGTPAVAALGQPDLTTNSLRPPSEFSLQTPGPLAIGPAGELWVAELASPITKVVRYHQAAAAMSGSAASGLLGRVDFYDQQTPATGSSTVFRNVEALHADATGRLWVMSQKGEVFDSTYVEYHLYRFDAAAAKPHGAPAESTVTVDPVPAAAIPPGPVMFGLGEGGPSQPSFFIDSAGGLVLFFVSTPFRFNNGFGTPASCILRLTDAASLPATINQPSQLDYAFKLTGLEGAARSMTPSADGHIWAVDGLSSVRRFKFPPFASPTSQQPASFEWVAGAGGDLLALRFASIPGRDYQLQSSPNLTEWRPGQKFSALGHTSLFMETPAPGKSFFKVLLLP